MLQPAARCRAAVPLAASDPIQASEAKAPLAESRGVCTAAWTSIRFDVSEAVFRFGFTDCPEYSRRTGSRESVDVRATGFGSEQSRPTSALGLGLRVWQRTRALHGPTVIRRMPRGARASRSVSRDGTLLAAGKGCQCRGCPCNWCRSGQVRLTWSSRFQGRFYPGISQFNGGISHRVSKRWD